MMLARYLGKKTDILDPLLRVVGDHAPPGSHVVDIFSGSLAVSLALKQHGYRVTANDINLFSAILAEAYLLPTRLPVIDLSNLLSRSRRQTLTRRADNLAAALRGTEGFTALAGNDEQFERFRTLCVVLCHLETLTPGFVPAADRRSHFFDAYCEAGRHSAFVSSRGTAGRRRFFISENARRIDLIENQLRVWRRERALSNQAHALLLANLIRAVEKVSNTQGTYHDFPRDTWDVRAFKPLTLKPAPVDPILVGGGGHITGRERDSLDFIAGVPKHSVLYIDPPYNFRQYTAYYFLPNLLCRYPDLDDTDEYFSRLAYVRGQNPDDDFVSTFCKPRRFVEDLLVLIDRASCDTVILSYFTGRNHWSKFDSGPDDKGRRLLRKALTGAQFERGSLRITDAMRVNYASYGGYKARMVSELFMSVRKRRSRRRSVDPGRGTVDGFHEVA